MKSGMTKNPAGIGGKREDTAFGGFVSFTGGDSLRRLHERNYSKGTHAADAKASQSDVIPLLDISVPKVVR